jgi:uncharacterized protein (DUF2384 family)
MTTSGTSAARAAAARRRKSAAGATAKIVGRPGRLDAALGQSKVEARVFALLEDKGLRNWLHGPTRTNLAAVWVQIVKRLGRQNNELTVLRDPLETHRKVVEGLHGESLLIASAMLWDSLSEAEGFFDITFKTMRSKIGGRLSPALGELALRVARVLETAAETFGDYEAARRYLRTRNFALGGATPRDLLKTADGERIVLNELQAQADSGPL